MKAVWALAAKTIRSAVRSRVVHVILFFCLLTVFVLPMTISSDGTAKGLVQVSLTYALGIIGFLLSTVALWLGCVLMSDDIEGYQIHMVVSKPVARWQIWLGKWFGIVLLLTGILTISSAAILGMTYWRLSASGFPAEEMKRLKAEVLIGRRVHRPKPIDIEKQAKVTLQARLRYTNGELPPNMTMGMALGTITDQLERSQDEVRFLNPRRWEFEGLPTDYDKEFFSLRYRLYVNRVKQKQQRVTNGQWFLYNPSATNENEAFIPLPVRREVGGQFAELHLSTKLISKEGRFALEYRNLDPRGESVVLPAIDGPNLMFGAVGFWNNFSRVASLILIQVLFMATLGCAAGATLSTPVAIFMSFTYVLTGVLVRFVRADDLPRSSNLLMWMISYFQDFVQIATVSLNDFIQVTPLTRGEIIESSAILVSLLTVLFIRGGLVAAIGIFGFSRRELGLVIRK